MARAGHSFRNPGSCGLCSETLQYENASRVRAAADALDAMATKAEGLAELAMKMEVLWDRCRGGNETAADSLANPANEVRPADSEEAGPRLRQDPQTPLPIEFRPVLVRTALMLETRLPGMDGLGGAIRIKTNARRGIPEEN